MTLFAKTRHGEVLRSKDNGLSWSWFCTLAAWPLAVEIGYASGELLTFVDGQAVSL